MTHDEIVAFAERERLRDREFVARMTRDEAEQYLLECFEAFTKDPTHDNRTRLRLAVDVWMIKKTIVS